MKQSNIKELFVSNKLTLGSVESFTGGLFASEITSIPGASNFFKGAVVTYATEEKINILGIEKNLVDEFGVVSKEIAEQMAIKGHKLLNVDYCVSFTGNAGPLAMEVKPVGLVFIGVFDGQKCHVLEKNISGSRDFVRQQAINIAFDYIESLVTQK